MVKGFKIKGYLGFKSSSASIKNLNLSSGEAKTLLHQSGQLTNAFAALAEHTLRSGSHYNDFSAGRGPSDFHARVAILGKFLRKFQMRKCY
jgi:hypothetical protein